MASTTYIAVLLLASLSIVTTSIGVALAIRFSTHTRAISVGIGFSAGIMLLISFLELIPEARSDIGVARALVAVIAGITLIAILHLVIPHTHLVEEKRSVDARLLKSAYLVVFGLILHDFPEGFAMANSYVASPELGILVALSIAIHNLPEEFAMAVPLVPLRKKKLLYGAAALSALAEPAGAIIGLVAVDVLPGLNPLLMAFAAGAMIFVSLHELFPLARRYGNVRLLVLGLGLSCFAYLALGWMVPQ